MDHEFKLIYQEKLKGFVTLLGGNIRNKHRSRDPFN